MYTSYTGPSSLYPLPFPLPLAFHRPFSSPFPLSLLFVLSPCLLCPVSSPVSIGLPFFSENYTRGRNIYRCIGSFMYRSVPFLSLLSIFPFFLSFPFLFFQIRNHYTGRLKGVNLRKSANFSIILYNIYYIKYIILRWEEFIVWADCRIRILYLFYISILGLFLVYTYLVLKDWR